MCAGAFIPALTGLGAKPVLWAVAAMVGLCCAIVTGYTGGGAIGPLVSGAALQLAGVIGLSGWLSAMALATLVAARRMGRPAA